MRGQHIKVILTWTAIGTATFCFFGFTGLGIAAVICAILI